QTKTIVATEAFEHDLIGSTTAGNDEGHRTILPGPLESCGGAFAGVATIPRRALAIDFHPIELVFRAPIARGRRDDAGIGGRRTLFRAGLRSTSVLLLKP